MVVSDISVRSVRRVLLHHHPLLPEFAAQEVLPWVSTSDVSDAPLDTTSGCP
jgi:hypothetical protein